MQKTDSPIIEVVDVNEINKAIRAARQCIALPITRWSEIANYQLVIKNKLLEVKMVNGKTVSKFTEKGLKWSDYYIRHR